jgi:hypothetical protein
LTIVRVALPLSILGLLAAAGAQPPRVLGRSPLEGLVSIESGRFTRAGSPELLVVQRIGELDARSSLSSERARVSLHRLAVLAFNGEGFTPLWTSQPLLGREAARLGLSPTVWAAGDVDGNGFDELLVIQADSCCILSFAGESLSRTDALLPGARPFDALCRDVDADTLVDVVTLELTAADSARPRAYIRLWQPALPEFLPRSETIPCFPADSEPDVFFTGAARLEDYDGELPVAAGTFASLRPSLYAALYRAGEDSFALTTNPFPVAEWFSKQQVLPAGRLSLFNVGDTLVAWGYFVPGSRPGGPAQSFAALQDGEWRLLRLNEHAARVSGPMCRYSIGGVNGWLELRDNVFRFSPGDVFHWR